MALSSQASAQAERTLHFRVASMHLHSLPEGVQCGALSGRSCEPSCRLEVSFGSLGPVCKDPV